jgi:hypothetical protein
MGLVKRAVAVGALVVAATAIETVVIGAGAASAAYGAPEILASRSRLYRTDYAWSDQRETLRVTTIDARGARQERMVEIHERRYPDGARKALLAFTAPDAIKGTAVLSQQRAGSAAERWLYLPRQKRARRFGGQLRDEGLMGTDLTGAELDLLTDMLTWTAVDVRATLRGRKPLRGAETWELEIGNVPEYSRIVLWVGAGDFVMRQVELYGAADAGLVKRVRQSDVRLVGTVPVPGRVEVENPRTGTASVFEVVDVAFDVGFSDEVFSLPRLESPPS